MVSKVMVELIVGLELGLGMGEYVRLSSVTVIAAKSNWLLTERKRHI